MLRFLGVGLVAALVLTAGGASREPLTKQEYLTLVQGAIDPKATERLFDDVVNFTYYVDRCVRICRQDTVTRAGEEWLRSERLLRRDMDAITRPFRRLRPPADIARLHASWIAALRRCSAALRSLEADQRRFASGDFEMHVAERIQPVCFERFNEIIPAFEQRGYVFSSAS